MEILERQDDIGPPTALSPKEMDLIVNLAKISSKDVFYDLGSGTGKFVLYVAQNTKAKKAVGIEIDFRRFYRSVRNARQELTKSQLKRTDFYCANYDLYDISDASVIYEGHERIEDETEKLDEMLNGHRARIVTTDLPLIGCKPLNYASYKGRKFFLMQTPLKNYKVRNPDNWASSVLHKPSRLKDVYTYYDGILEKRKFKKHERKGAVSELRRVVRSYF
jgi:SAM-dependent methyltransferase